MIWRSKGKQREKRWRKRVLISTVLVLSIVLPIARYGPRAWSRWQQHHLVGVARVLLEHADYKKAALSLRQVLAMNPSNLEASRLFADLAEAIGKTEAVALRERVCVLAPDSYEDAYAWALTALRFGDLPRAREALAILKKTGPNRSGYHAVLGRLAQNAGQLPQARAEYTTALQLDPNDEKMQFEAAVLDLELGDASKRDAALETMERLRIKPAFHSAASRALAAAYASEGKVEKALPIAKEMGAAKGADVQDRLLYLTLLKGSNNPHFIAYLTDLQNDVQDKPLEASRFVAWANSHDMAALVHEWVGTLPPSMVNTPPMVQEVAETCSILQEWKELKSYSENPGWGDDEYLRLAFLSRALLGLGDQVNSDLQWKAAIASVAKRSERLYALARDASRWGWNDRWEGLLWFISENTRHPQPALQALAAKYSKARDTRSLYRALTALFDNSPGDSALKNNWCMLALLLRADVDRAQQAAQELYQANPVDPHTVATYAFALYSANRTDDALEVMRKLPPAQLQAPSVAAYYGLLLAAVRDPEAEKYLSLARKARLLPEEEMIVKKAELALSDK